MLTPGNDPAVEEGAERHWTTPAYGEVVKALPATGAAVQLAGVTGQWAHCDVWMQAPLAWLPARLRVYGLHGNIRVPLIDGVIGAMAPVIVGTQAVGIVASLRGRPCQGFTAEVLPYGVAAGQATWRMQAWGHEASMTDQQERTLTDKFAGRWQAETPASLSLAVGDNALPELAAAPNLRRVVTHVLVSSDDVATRQVQLVEVTPAAVRTVRRVYFVGAGRSAVVDGVDQAGELRGGRGSSWLLNLDALSPGQEVRATVAGFTE